jgi:hypothetical protein
MNRSAAVVKRINEAIRLLCSSRTNENCDSTTLKLKHCQNFSSQSYSVRLIPNQLISQHKVPRFMLCFDNFPLDKVELLELKEQGCTNLLTDVPLREIGRLLCRATYFFSFFDIQLK